MGEAEIERQYGAQNSIVSGVLKKKHAAVRWAMRALMGALPATILKLVHYDRRLGMSDARIEPFKSMVNCFPPPPRHGRKTSRANL